MSDHRTLLSHDYFLDEDVVTLARNLLGKTIYTQLGNQITSGFIVETEAYRAPDDRGCHAFDNRQTNRTKTMFLNGGHAYVYICYGIHPMFNIVTGPENFAHAILIRAIQPEEGIHIMANRRGLDSHKYTLTNGPGKLAIALGIDKNMDGIPLFDAQSDIQIFQEGLHLKPDNIISGPRVGMSRHVGSCAHRPWRFYIKNNPWVSKPLVVDYMGKW